MSHRPDQRRDAVRVRSLELTAAEQAALEVQLRDVSAEADGLFAIGFVALKDVGALLGEALLGNQDAPRLLRAFRAAVANVTKPPRGRPVLCLTCPKGISHGDRFTVAVILPLLRDDPHESLSLVVCATCADDGDLKAKALVALRRMGWVGLRPFTITPGRGRA